MIDNDYCGTVPRKPFLLGQLSIAKLFATDAAMLARMGIAGQIQDLEAIRRKAHSTYDILSRLAAGASHCELVGELDAAIEEANALVKMTADGSASMDAIHTQALRLIKITIKIGKVVITIEF